MEFTEDYPNKPPVVKFVSKVFHPNVYANGMLLRSRVLAETLRCVCGYFYRQPICCARADCFGAQAQSASTFFKTSGARSMTLPPY